MLIADTSIIISNKLNKHPPLQSKFTKKELVWKNEFEFSVKKGLMAMQRSSWKILWTLQICIWKDTAYNMWVII